MCPACSRYSVICNESARVKKKKNIEAYRWIVLWEMQRCRQIYIYIYIIFNIYIYLLLIGYNHIQIYSNYGSGLKKIHVVSAFSPSYFLRCE